MGNNIAREMQTSSIEIGALSLQLIDSHRCCNLHGKRIVESDDRNEGLGRAV